MHPSPLLNCLAGFLHLEDLPTVTGPSHSSHILVDAVLLGEANYIKYCLGLQPVSRLES